MKHTRLASGIALAFLVVVVWGCGSSSDTETEQPSSAATTEKEQPAAAAETEKPDERARALTAWRRYIRPRARADAEEAGGSLVKLEPSVGEPKDYGQGFKQSVGTAYAEVEAPSGFSGGLIYSAELRDTSGAWRVQPGSLEEKKP